jgi:dTDP-glucose pyrophosphorylase
MTGANKKYLPNYRDCIIGLDSTIKQALSAISKSGALLAAMVDDSGRLEGIFTDSDARRAILSGASVEDSVYPFMKSNPVVGGDNAEPHELRNLAESEGIREIPLVDAAGCLVDVFVVNAHEERISSDQLTSVSPPGKRLSSPMLLIAGGKGTRLRSVVKDVPKPLALVGDRPIIQTIIENAANSGINRFYVSVNYKADQIEEHLNSGIYKDLELNLIRENEFLGTAGSLGYLDDEWLEPLVVSNADVLSKVALDRVVEYHITTEAIVTCVVRPYHVQVPFGVVEIGPNGVSRIREKPTHKHVVNTGIYVFSPKVRQYITKGEKIDMPDLLQMIIAGGQKVVPYLLHEYWRDIGRPEEYALANQEYHEIFGSGS